MTHTRERYELAGKAWEPCPSTLTEALGVREDSSVQSI